MKTLRKTRRQLVNCLIGGVADLAPVLLCIKAGEAAECPACMSNSASAEPLAFARKQLLQFVPPAAV